MADKNTADIGFEKEIWDAACVLRGNMDASEYKNVILGLIFLKYISDSFETKYQELVAEGEGFEEDRDEYTSENIFFVPEGARWKDIAEAAHTPEIGIVIDNAMSAIEAENNIHVAEANGYERILQINTDLRDKLKEIIAAVTGEADG